MGFRFLLVIAAGALMLAATIYLIRCFHRFHILDALGKQHRLLSWVLALLPVACISLLALYNAATLFTVLVHLVLGFLLCDAIAWLIHLLLHRTISYDLRGATALLLTAVYLGIGCFLAFHVFETHYSVSTKKVLSEDLRIVALADSHLGVTLDGERFAKQTARISTLQPDLVIVVGDFVDDDSDRKDMLRACRALGELQTTYGVYFVYGNHDNGYSQYRNFSASELRRALEENGVIVLTDDWTSVGNDVILVGRRDRSMEDRLDIRTLMESVDPQKYCIVLDHQPNDYTNEAAAGVDLVLSGHTHGGHIFPAGLIGLWIGANDRVYGSETRGDTTFLVTSGISGWAIPIKTGTASEFVVIDVHSAATHE
ncbi:MAG: metallophosphoesterase [Clostridia bacterium]|nr:metallophosphoesterase [Clostridia bacterium]